MVDMDAVLGEVKRTAYVGLGTFGSALVGNGLSRLLPGDDVSDVAVAGGQAVVGAGAASLAELRMDPMETEGLGFDFGEAAQHVGYGVGGAGFAEAADLLSQDGGGSEVVEVRTRSNASRATSTSNVSKEQHNEREEFLADIG